MGKSPDASKVPDEALMERYVKGDVGAFEVLFDRYTWPIASLLYRRSGDVHLAESLTQQTFLQIIEARDRFDPARPFHAWIYTIANNLLRNELARSARSPLVEGEFNETLQRDETPTPEELADLAETRTRLLAALDQLPDDQREVIIQHEIEGLTHREIAHLTGEPVGTLRSRLFRAIERLRDML